MAGPISLTNDDERVSFAIELGWDPDPALEGEALDREAERFFAFQNVADLAGEGLPDGVDQALLDEVRDAVLRRAQRTT